MHLRSVNAKLSSNWFVALLADLHGELQGTEAEQHLGPALLGRAGAGRGVAPRGRWEGTSWARWPCDLARFFSHPVTISHLQHANSLKRIAFLFVWLQKVFPQVFSLHENNLPSPLGWDCFTLLWMFGLAARTLGGTTALKRSFSLC